MKNTVASAFAHHNSLKSEYDAARPDRTTRRRNLPVAGAHADYHFRNDTDFLRMIETARDIDRNDMVAGPGITQAVNNIIGPGFGLKPRTGDEDLNNEIHDRFVSWSTDERQCNAAKEYTFRDMEQLVCRHMLVDGDCFTIPGYDGTLDIVESHRIRTPTNTSLNVVHGILLNEQRQKQEYWITREEINPWQQLQRVSDVVKLPARDSEDYRNVFHIYNSKRYSQTRGVSALVPTMKAITMFDDMQFASLVKQVISNAFAIIREKQPMPQGQGRRKRQDLGPKTSEQVSGSDFQRIVENIMPGMEIEGREGETIKGFAPNIPGASFFDHSELILTFISINLGMPLFLLTMDASKTNFSGFRGAMDMAKRGFRSNQDSLIDRFHRHVYNFLIRFWASEDPAFADRIAKVGDMAFRHDWIKPGWPYIEPLKDRTADVLSLRNMFTSPRRYHEEKQQDYREIVNETIEDNAYAIMAAKEKAAEINKQFPDNPIHWRELISIPTPEGLSLNIALDQAQEQERTNAS